MKRIIEYTFILALIAVFVILFLMLLNDKLEHVF
jgi:Flp pilus assembly pilin Flp